MTVYKFGALVSLFALTICVSSWAEEACSAQGAHTQKIKVGDVQPYYAESKHPYDNGSAERNVVWKDVVSSPGAKFVRLHFSAFDLNDGDFVTVSNPSGSDFWTYTLKGLRGTGKFWTFAVDGDTAIVKLHAGPKGRSYGYQIDKIGHGTFDWKQDHQVTAEVLCGTQGNQDIACHTANATINKAQKAVTRMLYTSGGYQYLCTGWLVRGSNASTMITNNHCIDTQAEASSLQARFNFQKTSCGGAAIAATTDYAGGQLLKTDRRLDYTLMTLQSNPEATWGELIPTRRAAPIGQLIWFIQHPAGQPKQIGLFEDAAKTVRCKIARINQSYSGTTKKSQMAYACDSAGGSSGSPILSATDGKAIGLHHFGGVVTSACLNAATEMPEICSNAGSLLTCDIN